jgi:hypothetical protein
VKDVYFTVTIVSLSVKSIHWPLPYPLIDMAVHVFVMLLPTVRTCVSLSDTNCQYECNSACMYVRVGP